MVDDALALGVKHAALNVNLSSLIEVTNRPGFLRWTRNENEDFYFNTGRIEAWIARSKLCLTRMWSSA